MPAVYRPYVEHTVISWEIDVPTENELAARIAAAQAGHEWLVLERDRRVIGFAYGHAFNRLATYQWSTEAGIYVDADRCRSGGGRALYAELLRRVSARGYRQAFAIGEKPRPQENWVLTMRIISGRRSPSERARRDSNP